MKKKSAFRLFGIFGHPLVHTLSPAMQEAAFQAAGIDAYYGVFDLEESFFRKTLSARSGFLLEGFNVTIPYKQKVLAFLNQITPEARAVGAVNTVSRRGAKWIGTNTDVYGFLKSLSAASFKTRGKRAVVFGAGGAARAVVYGLASQGVVSIVIVNRHQEKAQKLAREFSKMFPRVAIKTGAANEVAKADLVVNATSLGLKAADPNVLEASVIPQAGKKIFFVDLIYHVQRTPFLQAAAKKGHRVLNGLEMLLYQGARAFEIWTGKSAPLTAMRAALVGALKHD